MNKLSRSFLTSIKRWPAQHFPTSVAIAPICIRHASGSSGSSSARDALDHVVVGPNGKKLTNKEAAQLKEDNRAAYLVAMDFYRKDVQTLAKWMDISVIKYQGRVHPPDYMPLPTTNIQCIPFPLDTTVTTLNRETMTIDEMSPIIPGTDNERGLRFISFSFKSWGATLSNSWLQPFLASDLGGVIPCLDISVVEWRFLNLVKGSFINKSKEVVPEVRWHKTAYAFGGLMEFATKLLLPNKFTGYAYLVDSAGRVRWRACGSATPDEAERMIKVAHMLYKEQQNTLASRIASARPKQEEKEKM